MPRGDFELVTHPALQPAVDFITRSGEGPFVDTGVDVVLRAQPGAPFVKERVYLSVATIRQLAHLVDIDLSAAATREQALLAQGRLEGFNENVGSELVAVVSTLRRWLDAVGSPSHTPLGNEAG